MLNFGALIFQPSTHSSDRNWEGFAADPYLSGALAAETVMGMQQSVIASVKHFIAYEQETNRNPSGYNASVSSNVDDTTMHELYLWPFQDTVRVGAGCIMCSYNRVNNSYACQNSKTMNGLLKTELGFQGFVGMLWSIRLLGRNFRPGLQLLHLALVLLSRMQMTDISPVSDWGAQHTGYWSAYAGLDMAMPDSAFWQGNLVKAISNGSLEQSRLDDMATR